MCGIVGYVGPREAVEFLVVGLRRLEYRGYDSSGVATVTSEGKFALVKTAGRIERLEALLSQSSAPGRIGIGHTRWATMAPQATSMPILTWEATGRWPWSTTA